MTATIQTKVDELTDDAIKKRIAVIDRLRTTRLKHIDDISVELNTLSNERSDLVKVQIERLQAQLPEKE